MAASADPPNLDVARLIAVLDRHGVEYLLVGGVAAQVYGAQRQTVDFDCLARRTGENLDRLAGAMRELNARLRAEGMSDAEAALLPVRVDRSSLLRMEISTWRTDAGDLDILTDIPDRTGRHVGYDELVSRSDRLGHGGVVVQVASLEDIIASKEWADRPKDHEALPELRRLRDEVDSGEM